MVADRIAWPVHAVAAVRRQLQRARSRRVSRRHLPAACRVGRPGLLPFHREDDHRRWRPAAREEDRRPGHGHLGRARPIAAAGPRAVARPAVHEPDAQGAPSRRRPLGHRGPPRRGRAPRDRLPRRGRPIASRPMATARLDTARLRLEPTVVDEATALAFALADPVLYDFIGGEPPTAEALRARIAGWLAGPTRAGES